MSSLLPGLKKNLGVISSREIAPVVEGFLAERNKINRNTLQNLVFKKNNFFYFKLILLMFLDNFNVLILKIKF
jgi:hypothetical protein